MQGISVAVVWLTEEQSMRWSNVLNLPAPLAAAIRNDSYKSVGRISATGLIQPPQKRVLEYRHRDKIVTDVSENIFSLFGQVVHGILERSATPSEIAEKRLVVNILGWDVSGQADLVETLHASGGLLSDYKTLSVMSFQMGGKDHWSQQLNTYAFLFNKNGIEIKELQIVAIFRDWSLRKARRDRDYPQAGVQIVRVPLWPMEQTEAWITERVRLHQEAEKLPDSQLPACSPEDRWQSEGKWAVMKEGRKSAVRVFDSEAEADALLKEKDATHSKVSRPGEAIRCEDYCKAKAFCHQYKATIPEGVEVMGAI
jgi:hypothetical protein